jgi:hypothetical protein
MSCGACGLFSLIVFGHTNPKRQRVALRDTPSVALRVFEDRIAAAKKQAAAPRLRHGLSERF